MLFTEIFTLLENHFIFKKNVREILYEIKSNLFLLLHKN